MQLGGLGAVAAAARDVGVGVAARHERVAAASLGKLVRARLAVAEAGGGARVGRRRAPAALAEVGARRRDAADERGAVEGGAREHRLGAVAAGERREAARHRRDVGEVEAVHVHDRAAERDAGVGLDGAHAEVDERHHRVRAVGARPPRVAVALLADAQPVEGAVGRAGGERVGVGVEDVEVGVVVRAAVLRADTVLPNGWEP